MSDLVEFKHTLASHIEQNKIIDEITQIVSQILLTISFKVSLRLLHSSDTITMLGDVLRAHSNAKCDGSYPISLIKYQYLTAEALSVSMFPISWE